ncbi:hypothetical protein BDK51DRAFT_36593 [Blyttiomyces helicus]|uniref:Uncharacterized protein n=1 Tax=Blyttiomyces helicus TaxID=388810 RepID=A0A4P9WMJ9_9FUNG|nr:hypothetical protein BDK51DRAFT_36593 [Blyttiomyces helicus]|eukprot:RKO94299.1 hypothetical protein BDK51DRAFT_36593 [Blyttiomyces helicus]
MNMMLRSVLGVSSQARPTTRPTIASTLQPPSFLEPEDLLPPTPASLGKDFTNYYSIPERPPLGTKDHKYELSSDKMTKAVRTDPAETAACTLQAMSSYMIWLAQADAR